MMVQLDWRTSLGAEASVEPFTPSSWLEGNHITGKGLPYSSDGKESDCNAGDLGSISESGRSPGEGNGNPLQYSCLGNPMDRGAWQATVHGVAKRPTRLRNIQCWWGYGEMMAIIQYSMECKLEIAYWKGNQKIFIEFWKTVVTFQVPMLRKHSETQTSEWMVFITVWLQWKREANQQGWKS